MKYPSKSPSTPSLGDPIRFLAQLTPCPGVRAPEGRSPVPLHLIPAAQHPPWGPLYITTKQTGKFCDYYTRSVTKFLNIQGKSVSKYKPMGKCSPLHFHFIHLWSKTIPPASLSTWLDSMDTSLSTVFTLPQAGAYRATSLPNLLVHPPFFFFFPQKTHTLPNHSFGHPAWSRLIIGHRPVHSDWSSNATGPKLRRSETRSVGPLEKILFSTWSRVCPQSSQPPYPIQWEETWESQKRNKPCSRLEGRSPSSPGAQMLWAAGQRSNLPSLYPI